MEALIQNTKHRSKIQLSTGAAVFVLLASVIVIGAISGLVWRLTVSLPIYTASEDGSVVMTERAQTQVFGADAMFVIIGCLAGLLLGICAWLLFNKLGWPVSFIAVLAGLGAGLVCWAVGASFGPHDFVTRVAEALPGDQIPIDFNLHAYSALLVWLLAASVPVTIYANFGPATEKLLTPKQHAPARAADPEPE